MKCAVLNVRATFGMITRKWKFAMLTVIGPPPANTMMNRRRNLMMKAINWKCEECIHSTQETADDVACCNCCEDGSFFEEYKDEYTLADLGNNWW